MDFSHAGAGGAGLAGFGPGGHPPGFPVPRVPRASGYGLVRFWWLKLAAMFTSHFLGNGFYHL